MDKLSHKLNIVLLSDFYLPLLTKKQRYIVEEYYYNDISLTEIANNLNITRQSVKDTLNRIEETLYSFEEKLGLLKKYKQTRQTVQDLIKDSKSSKTKDKLQSILKIWERE